MKWCLYFQELSCYGLVHAVTLEFLAQGVRGLMPIITAARVWLPRVYCMITSSMGSFDFGENHIVQINHFLTVQLGRVVTQGLLHRVTQGALGRLGSVIVSGCYQCIRSQGLFEHIRSALWLCVNLIHRNTLSASLSCASAQSRALKCLQNSRPASSSRYQPTCLRANARSQIGTVKLVQIGDMLVHQGANLFPVGRRQFGARFKKMADFPENPGSSLRSTADHHGVNTGIVEDIPGFLQAIDVAIGDNRNRYGLLNRLIVSYSASPL